MEMESGARFLAFSIFSENKGADQLRGYREAELRICFSICKSMFSHDAIPMNCNCDRT